MGKDKKTDACEEAFTYIDSALATLNANRGVHFTLQNALLLLKNEIINGHERIDDLEERNRILKARVKAFEHAANFRVSFQESDGGGAVDIPPGLLEK